MMAIGASVGLKKFWALRQEATRDESLASLRIT